MTGLTDLYKKIYMETSKINYGKTSSYLEIAQKIKNKNYARIVGTALGKNPLPLIIPCHRVIKKNGGIGGFMQSAEDKSGWKKFLIKLEKF
mgnify:CR=1 FL=1